MTEIEMLREHILCTIKTSTFSVKFTGPNAPDKAMWMNEAREYLVKCAGKLDKVIEVEK